jgi:hypothetical protein
MAILFQQGIVKSMPREPPDDVLTDQGREHQRWHE